MFTKLVSVEEYKEIFVEILINKTDSVTKVSDGSVLNGVSYGVAKIAQKINKDIALLESKIFPDTASGKSLDDIATLWGVGKRFGAKQSSTYVRLFGDAGTTYVAGTHVLKSNNGVEFDFDKNVTMPSFGWTYAKVRSRTTGVNTNVDGLTITQITPSPIGHKFVINEYVGQYGSDRENDDVYRKRIKEGANLLSRSTISQIEQVFMKVNENVLKVYYGGGDGQGRIILNVLSENGIDFNTPEFNDILLRSEKFFSLSEFRPSNFNGYGVKLQNVNWMPVDISMRLDIDPSYNIDEVRKEIQIRIGKYFDYRYWRPGDLIEWDNLLDIAKKTPGVRYVNDAYFYPSTDIQTEVFKLPRIRGFQLLDLDGNLIQNYSGTLNPVYYPQEKDFSFLSTVLQNI